MIRAIFITLSILITIIYSELNWAECPAGQSKMIEIIPNGCSYLIPYEYETWRYTKEGEKIVSKDILEKVKLIATTEESKKTILEQYYGAIISVLDEEKSRRICGDRQNCLRPQRSYFYPTRDKNICQRFKEDVPINMIVEKPCCEGNPSAPCLFGDGSMEILKDIAK